MKKDQNLIIFKSFYNFILFIGLLEVPNKILPTQLINLQFSITFNRNLWFQSVISISTCHQQSYV